MHGDSGGERNNRGSMARTKSTVSKWASVAELIVLAALFVTAPTAQTQKASTPAGEKGGRSRSGALSEEARTARELESVRNNPLKLYAFLYRSMPRRGFGTLRRTVCVWTPPRTNWFSHRMEIARLERFPRHGLRVTRRFMMS